MARKKDGASRPIRALRGECVMEKAAMYLKAFKVIRNKCKEAISCADCEIANEFAACPILNMPESKRPEDWKMYNE